MSGGDRGMQPLEAGDPLEPFEAAVRRSTPRLMAVALRYLRDPEEAADVLQDAFLSAIRSLPHFEGRAQLTTWLHRIVVNAALMRLRSRRRRPETPLGESVGRVGFSLETPEWHLERLRVRQQVREAVARLPPQARDAVARCDLLELDRSTVARSLGIQRDALKMRLHRGRRALRNDLSRHR